MIKLPKSFIEEGYKFEAEIPTAKLETERTPEGSFVIRARWEANGIEELAKQAAIKMNEKVEAAIMDELLRMNGYVPERTCRIKQHRCTNCDHEINDRAYFAKVVLDDGCLTAESRTANYCPNCGAKVVQPWSKGEKMGDEIRELEQRVIDLLGKVRGDELNCEGIRCEQCPLHQSNISIAARGFARELVYERGVKVVQE